MEIQESAIAQSDVYKTVPRQIDNRERLMVDVISFNFRNMLLDLLSDTSIFGDLDNLVVNKTNPYLPYRNTDGVQMRYWMVLGTGIPSTGLKYTSQTHSRKR